MKAIKRVKNFRNMGIGYFIHFGLYNLISKGEWYQNMYNLSSKEYYEIFDNCSNLDLKLNIKKIVKSAKNNGFKYIVLTSKHHDGFCLFDSKGTSKYDINNTINKNDILSEFIQECIDNDIKPFIYYATLDWHWDSQEIPFEEQLKKINEQITILLKNYPKVSGFWFDGNWSRKEENWKEKELYSIIRKYNPEAMIINNSGLTNCGKEQSDEVDSITFEQGHLSSINYKNFKRDLAAEACQSFNDHWGYAENDFNFKSVKYLILKFLEARREKANYLLNVSIDKKGNMLKIEEETIKVFRNWVKKFGKFLFEEYDIISNNNEDFIIKTNKGKIYGFLYNLPSGGHVKIIQNGGKIQPQREFMLIEDLKKEPQNIKMLDNEEFINFKLNEKQLIIEPTASNYGYNTIVRVFEINL